MPRELVQRVIKRAPRRHLRASARGVLPGPIVGFLLKHRDGFFARRVVDILGQQRLDLLQERQRIALIRREIRICGRIRRFERVLLAVVRVRAHGVLRQNSSSAVGAVRRRVADFLERSIRGRLRARRIRRHRECERADRHERSASASVRARGRRGGDVPRGIGCPRERRRRRRRRRREDDARGRGRGRSRARDDRFPARDDGGGGSECEHGTWFASASVATR